MNNTLWDTLYNIILLIFWSAIWEYSGFRLFTNSLLAPIIRFQRNSLAFLKPILPFMNEQAIAATAFIVLVAFRGIAIPPNAEWNITFGLIIARTAGSPLLINIFFSAISFAIFIFKICCLSLLYAKTKQTAMMTDATSLLYYLAKPFSIISVSIKPPVLVVAGMLIAFLMRILTAATAPASIIVNVIQLFLISLSGIISILPIIGQLVFAAIIMSLISALTASMQANALSNNFINILIGPMRKYPIQIGMFDLTPIIFMFALSLIHALLQGIIINALNGIL